MKRALSAFVIAAVGMTALPAQAELLDEVRERGTLVCGVLNNLEPFGFLDPANREVVGYEIDLCNDFAAYLGVEPELKVVTSQARMPELLQGRIDMLAALISWSPERAEQVDFSDTYVADSFQAITTTDSGMTELDDIANARVSVIKGSFLEPMVQQRYPDAEVVSFDDAATTFMAVAQGRVDATVQRTTQARALQLRLGDADNTVMLNPPLMVQKTGFTVRKGNPEFVAEMNRFLDEYEASGAAMELFDRWIGKDSPFNLERTFVVGEPITD